MFIHGGYWQARAKEIFTVMAEGPMAHGINVALIGYTLAPEATLDESSPKSMRGSTFSPDNCRARRRGSSRIWFDFTGAPSLTVIDAVHKNGRPGQGRMVFGRYRP